MTVDWLLESLGREADRRQQMGHHEVAHELRGEASRVRAAVAYLTASKKVKAPRVKRL